MKTQINKVTANLVGAAAGAGLAWWVGKKYVSNKWGVIAVVLIGAVVGAHAQAAIKARSGASKSAEMAKK